MARRSSWQTRPPTLEEYRAVDPDRPLTDPPLGTATASRRALDARLSQLVATPDRRKQ